MAIAELRSSITTSATRDTGIDFVRALCVLGVVVLHSLMVGVTVTDAGPLFANASDGAAWITPLSWVLQVMPLFFVIGGFAGYTALRRSQQRGGTAKEFVAARIHRLVLPAVFTIGVVGVGLTLLLLNGVPADLVATAGYRYGQPLWFLGVFLLCQALLPLFAAAHRRARWITIELMVTTAVAVDAVRNATGIDGLGFMNLAFVWLALQQLGFFFADGRIDALTRRTRIAIGVSAVAILIATFITGVYSPDLIANINPPTASLLLVGVAHTMLLSLMREQVSRWSRLPLPNRFLTFVTPRAMTIYLWHMPVLLAMAGVSAIFAMMTGMALPEPSSVEWWMTRPVWLVTVVALTAGLAFFLAGIEARRIPTPTRSAKRLVAASTIGTAAIVGLLVVGTTPVTALVAVVLLIVSLRLARPGHGDSAAWPSRRAGIAATSTRAMQNA